MKVLLFVLIVALLLAIYVAWGRKWLKTKPWADGYFRLIEPIEIFLFSKSETILWARLKQFTGVALTFLTQAGAIDITPLMPFVPDQYEGYVRAAFNCIPLVITLMGIVDEKLRRDTTKPLELVAIADKDITPAVASAIAVAEVAKVQAVTEIKEAEVVKAEAAKV